MKRIHTSRFAAGLQLMVLLTGGTLYGQNPSQQQRVTLTPAMVASALSQQGLEVVADQLEMPARLSAMGTPELQVIRAELVAPKMLRIRLACRQTAQCLPFLVLVHLEANAPDLLKLATLTEASSRQVPPSTLNSNRLLAGQQVILVMEDKHMRISLPVIAIDSGAHGADVRVASLDHKQSYRATVESAALVRGVLP